MSEPAADKLRRLETRIVELESLYSHLERTLTDLDQVVLAQQRQLDAWASKSAALESDFRALSGALAPPLKPEDEKPPHY